jgi:hypothetical protein
MMIFLCKHTLPDNQNIDIRNLQLRHGYRVLILSEYKLSRATHLFFVFLNPSKRSNGYITFRYFLNFIHKGMEIGGLS